MTSPAIHDLLEEAADRALDGVPAPDPHAALALARRDRLGRNRFRLAALVAAAAVVAVVGSTLLSGGTALLHRSAPAAGPTGLPGRWWTPPEWTPSVVGRPIAAASLLLDTTVVATGDGGVDGLDGGLVRGLVVVSADGTTYRRLPVPDGATAVLSPSGRRVAWVVGDPGRGSLVVLDLATGKRRTTALPGSHPEVAAMSWQPDDAAVVVSSEIEARIGATGVWRVGLDGRPTTVCRCGSGVTAFAHPTQGQVLVTPAAAGVWLPVGGPDLPGLTGARRAAVLSVTVTLGRNGPARSAFSPDGTRVAVVPGAATDDPADDADVLVTDRRGDVRSVRLAGFTGVRVLAWTPRGVLVAGIPPDGPQGLWLVAPDGAGAPVRVATGDGGSEPARVVGVATDLAASGRTVPGAEPDRSHRTVAYLRYRVEASVPYRLLTDGEPPRWLVLTGTVLVLEGLRRLHLRGRRRAGRKPAG